MSFYPDAFPSRIIAGRDHSGSSVLGHFHRTKPARTMRGKIRMIAESWNGDRQLLADFQKGRIFLRLYFLSVNGQGNHKGTAKEVGGALCFRFEVRGSLRLILLPLSFFASCLESLKGTLLQPPTNSLNSYCVKLASLIAGPALHAFISVQPMGFFLLSGDRIHRADFETGSAAGAFFGVD